MCPVKCLTCLTAVPATFAHTSLTICMGEASRTEAPHGCCEAWAHWETMCFIKCSRFQLAGCIHQLAGEQRQFNKQSDRQVKKSIQSLVGLGNGGGPWGVGFLYIYFFFVSTYSSIWIQHTILTTGFKFSNYWLGRSSRWWVDCSFEWLFDCVMSFSWCGVRQLTRELFRQLISRKNNHASSFSCTSCCIPFIQTNTSPGP